MKKLGKNKSNKPVHVLTNQQRIKPNQIIGLGLIFLMIALSLIFFSFDNISKILIPISLKQPSISGFDLFHDNIDNFTTFIGLVPIPESNNIRVTIAIENWEEVSNNCNIIQLHFPGITYNHAYLIASEIPLEKADLSEEEFDVLSSRSDLRTLGNKMELVADTFGGDIITIQPKILNDFIGVIEFDWQDGLQHFEYAKDKLLLPFGAVNPKQTGLSNDDLYTIHFWHTSEFSIVLSTPQPSKFQLYNNYVMYYFDIDIQKTDFTVTLENDYLSETRDYHIVIWSTIFGIGSALVVETLVFMIRALLLKN